MLDVTFEIEIIIIIEVIKNNTPKIDKKIELKLKRRYLESLSIYLAPNG